MQDLIFLIGHFLVLKHKGPVKCVKVRDKIFVILSFKKNLSPLWTDLHFMEDIGNWKVLFKWHASCHLLGNVLELSHLTTIGGPWYFW